MLFGLALVGVMSRVARKDAAARHARISPDRPEYNPYTRIPSSTARSVKAFCLKILLSTDRSKKPSNRALHASWEWELLGQVPKGRRTG